MVGRVIGKGGETIKALQQYTGASIQIDQSFEPTAVTISGQPAAVSLAVAMVQDIVNGSFKGFAMLRQMVLHASAGGEGGPEGAGPLPVYIEGYGFVPPTQFYSPEELAGAKLQGMMGGFSAVPRTPPSHPAQRALNIPLAGLPGTPPYESVLAGSPDISQVLSSLRLGEAGATVSMPIGTAGTPAGLWSASEPHERGLPLGAAATGGMASMSGGAGRTEGLAGAAAPMTSGHGGGLGGTRQEGLINLSSVGAESLAGLSGGVGGEGFSGLPLASAGGSGLSSLEPPSEQASPRGSLPSGWMRIFDPDGRMFYFSPRTGKSQWDVPTD